MIIWNPIHILSGNSFGSCSFCRNESTISAHLLIASILRQSLGAGDNTHTHREFNCVRAAANKTRPIDYTINPFSPPRCDCGARLNGRDPSRQALTIELASACKVFRLSLSHSTSLHVRVCVFECARPVRARLHSNGRKDELKQASRRKIVVVHERGSGCWQMCWVISSSRPLHSSLCAGARIYLMPKPPPL
jgi:hypothetical protein